MPIKYRLHNKNWSCRKKDKIRQLTGIQGTEDFFLHFFGFLVTQNVKKYVSRQKSLEIFRKTYIIKNDQNKLLYKNGLT